MGMDASSLMDLVERSGGNCRTSFNSSKINGYIQGRTFKRRFKKCGVDVWELE